MIGHPLAVPAATLLGGLLFAFWTPLQAMTAQWSASPMYSHAITVPFISLWLIWARRDHFAVAAVRPARIVAAPVVLLALAMLVGGSVAAIQIVQQLGFVVAIAAAVLFVFGWQYFVIAAPAIGYLLFMVPIWEVFTNPLHAPFQQNSAQMGVALMKAVGVPAYREGTIIALPNVVLEVARACSGVNYLVAVLALALPLAFLRLRSWPRRILLVGSAVVISALANGVRVALIGVLAYAEIGSPLHGPFHVLHGLFVAGIGYVVLFTGLYVLEDGEDARTADRPDGTTARATPDSGRRWGASMPGAYALSLVFWIVALLGTSPASSPVALTQPLDHLPLTLGDRWAAEIHQAASGPPTSAWTAADEHLRRRYRHRSGRAADVDIWYFSAQHQDREVANFMASELHERARTRAVTRADGSTMTVNAISWPERREVGLFWYELGGHPESGEYRTKVRSAWNALRSGRTHAAAIMLTAVADEGDPEPALASLDDLADRIHAGLVGHWPGASPAVQPGSRP